MLLLKIQLELIQKELGIEEFRRLVEEYLGPGGVDGGHKFPTESADKLNALVDTYGLDAVSTIANSLL